MAIQPLPPPDENGLPSFDDAAQLPDPVISRAIGKSKRTIYRLRERNGFPAPSRYINGVGSTPWLYVKRWLLSQPTKAGMRGWDDQAA